MVGDVSIIQRGVWQSFKQAAASPAQMPLAQFMLSPFDLSGFSQSLLDALQKFLRHRELALLIRDPEDEVFRIQARCGYGEGDFSKVEFAPDSPLIRHFATHPMPTYCCQLERTPWLRFLPRQEGQALDSLRGGLFVPLSAGSGLVGLLVLGQKKSKLLPRGRDGLAAADCSHLAAIIEEALLYHRLKKEPKKSAFTQQPGQSGQLRHLEQTDRCIAHDLNNIFTTIFSHAQLLDNEASYPVYETRFPDNPQGRNGQALQHITAICQAVQDGEELVRSLSQVYGMQGLSGHPPDSHSPKVEVNDIIRSTLLMMEPRWRQGHISPPLLVGRSGYWQPRGLAQMVPGAVRGVQGTPPNLTVTLRPAGCVSGSPAELRRVLTNIISNAIDALPRSHGRIEVSSGQEGQWAIIRVKDNGRGIPHQVRGRIFEPLFTTKGQGGSGLGLCISQSIIERHGGRLEVESEEGRGSTFTILLPLAKSEGG